MILVVLVLQGACRAACRKLVGTLLLGRLQGIGVPGLQGLTLQPKRADVGVGDAQRKGICAPLGAELTGAYRTCRDARREVLGDVLLVCKPDLVHHVLGVRVHVVADQRCGAGCPGLQVRVGLRQAAHRCVILVGLGCPGNIRPGSRPKVLSSRSQRGLVVSLVRAYIGERLRLERRSAYELSRICASSATGGYVVEVVGVILRRRRGRCCVTVS